MKYRFDPLRNGKKKGCKNLYSEQLQFPRVSRTTQSNRLTLLGRDAHDFVLKLGLALHSASLHSSREI